MNAHRSDSAEQRAAEESVITKLSEELGVKLERNRPVRFEGGAHMIVDGFAEGPPTIAVEVYARYGKLASGQKHKIIADAFKLLAIRKVHPGAKLVIALTNEETRTSLRGGWRRVALETMGVDVEVVELSEEEQAGVRAAQLRQAEES